MFQRKLGGKKGLVSGSSLMEAGQITRDSRILPAFHAESPTFSLQPKVLIWKIMGKFMRFWRRVAATWKKQNYGMAEPMVEGGLVWCVALDHVQKKWVTAKSFLKCPEIKTRA